MPTVLEDLERKLQPNYVGWKDQYKAILSVLSIDPDEPMPTGICSGCGDNND